MPIGIYVPSDAHEPLAVREYNSLDDYQRAVGGNIEAVGLGPSGMYLFVNENGKLLSPRCNRRATIYWWLQKFPHHGGDVICGDAVLIGTTDDDGATQDVPGAVRQLLLSTTTYAVQLKLPDGRWAPGLILFADYFEAGRWAMQTAAERPDIEGFRIAAQK